MIYRENKNTPNPHRTISITLLPLNSKKTPSNNVMTDPMNKIGPHVVKSDFVVQAKIVNEIVMTLVIVAAIKTILGFEIEHIEETK